MKTMNKSTSLGWSLAVGQRSGTSSSPHLRSLLGNACGKFGQVSLPMLRATLFNVIAAAFILGGVGITTTIAAPMPLLLPQSTAFAILGRSCGGIQEKSYATGFDATSGYPTGVVYLQTRCSTGGRGGGTRTYWAWASAKWDFAGNALSTTKLATVPAYDPTFYAFDAYGDEVFNLNNVAYLNVPVPAAPSGVTAIQSGVQFQVSWMPNAVNPAAIASSTLTATPVASTAPILTATVIGAAASGLIGPLQPLTQYAITVVSTTVGGSGPASNPIYLTTAAASIAPSAPTGVTARWGTLSATTGAIIVNWKAAVPGDSPIDLYQVNIRDPDSGASFTQTVPGTTLTALFSAVDFIPDWFVIVRAHNVVGWGPWSASLILGGL